MRTLWPLVILMLVLATLVACSRSTPMVDEGFASESLVGHIVKMDIEAIEYTDGSKATFLPGERINDIEYLRDGRSSRFCAFINRNWTDWTTGMARWHEYTHPKPNVGRVESYAYANDGSTPTDTLTLIFADEPAEHGRIGITQRTYGPEALLRYVTYQRGE